MLDAAVRLSAHPYEDAMAHKGEARSRSCGSVIALSLELDGQGRIARLGLRPHACAVGQAAASLFADHAGGSTRGQIAAARAAIAAWLAGEGPQPDWPGIALIEPALAYPARHAAILLAWDAALAAMA
jgi:NifU-like protein involved in Fe-S cluster formation